MDCSLLGSSVYRIFQARILEWITISFSKGSSQPRDQTRISCFSCIAGRFFTAETPGKPYNMDTNLLFRFRALTSASVQFWLLPAYFPSPLGSLRWRKPPCSKLCHPSWGSPHPMTVHAYKAQSYHLTIWNNSEGPSRHHMAHQLYLRSPASLSTQSYFLNSLLGVISESTPNKPPHTSLHPRDCVLGNLT